MFTGMEADLPNDPAILKTEILALREEVSMLKEHIRQLLHKRFGASSEKYSPDQVGLFNEAEQEQPEEIDDTGAEEDEITVPAYTRKKAGRKPLPADLPRVRKEHDITDEEKICSCCHHPLHRMGEEISEQLDIIPAKVQVIQHVRPKYACRVSE